jgi:hypothetical protein
MRVRYLYSLCGLIAADNQGNAGAKELSDGHRRIDMACDRVEWPQSRRGSSPEWIAWPPLRESSGLAGNDRPGPGT